MEEKGKKNSNLLVVFNIILCLLVVGLCTYIVYDRIELAKNNDNANSANEKADKVEDEKEEEQEETYVNKIIETNDWVYDAEYRYSEGLPESYTDDYGEPQRHFLKDIVVPYINIDSAAAKEANNHFKEIFDSSIDTYRSVVFSQDPKLFIVISKYEKYIDKETLSVNLTNYVAATSAPQPNYYTYTFDLKTGDLLSYQDVYEKFGFTKDSIDEKVYNAIKSNVEKSYEISLKNGVMTKEKVDGMIDTFYNNYLNSVKDNTVKYFIDSNKKLNVVVHFKPLINIDPMEVYKILVIE